MCIICDNDCGCTLIFGRRAGQIFASRRANAAPSFEAIAANARVSLENRANRTVICCVHGQAGARRSTTTMSRRLRCKVGYRRRRNACVVVSPFCSLSPFDPGSFAAAQAEAWKAVGIAPGGAMGGAIGEWEGGGGSVSYLVDPPACAQSFPASL